VEKTYYPKPDEIQNDWYIVDAYGQTLGRLASKISRVLLGKHKPIFTPGVDTGDYVIVLNCGGVVVTGKKLDDKKYYHHTGFPGGIKEINLRDQLAQHPERALRLAVKGMLPKTTQGRNLLKRMKLFVGSEHTHGEQNPVVLPEEL
jgi:large subunit ribosomal protein L13